MENKNTLILSIVGVFVLIAVVVGISFAMFSFTGTGTRENVIETGSVTVNCTDQTMITLNNQYPVTDVVGASLTGNSEMTCNVTASIQGTIVLDYEVGFSDVREGATLKDDFIKFNITKDGAYLLGTSSTSGITMASRANQYGDVITDAFTEGYFLDSGTFNASGNHLYKVRAWVSQDYDLPGAGVVNNDNVHSSTTTSESFSFKFKVVAKQA